MTIDILPYEIFQLVASMLAIKTQDLAECCLVCTNWLPLFMEQLYLSITICGPPAFQRFYTCLATLPSTKYTQHRQLLIRILTIQDGNITQEQMDKLPSICPRLELLTIDGRAQWDNAMPLSINKVNSQQQQQQQATDVEVKHLAGKRNTTWWPHLKSACILATSITPTVMQNASQLTRLTLRCMFDGRLSRHLVSALQKTPLLKYLSIDEFESSLQQLESIHDACPLLVKLRLVHTLIDSTDHDFEIALSSASASPLSHHQKITFAVGISPSSSLRHFIIQEANTINENDDVVLSDWFIYIARKYPRLESLEWWQKSTYGFANTPHINTSVALFMATQCLHLNSARFFNIYMDPLFYRSLLEQNQQLTPLHQPSTSGIKGIGMNYSLDLRHYTQLRSYSLWWNEKESPLDYIPRLPSSLVNLHLSGRMCDSSFDINLILNQCPHLEFLHLDFGTLDQLLTARDYQRKKLHPLKRLIMEEIKLSTLSLKSVAFRCRDLVELDMLDCILTDDEPDRDGGIYQGTGNDNNNSMGINGDDVSNVGRNYGHLVFPFQRFEKVKLCGFRFANNPSLRAKSVGIYEMNKHRQSEQWYYLSHHATYLSYTPVHSCRYKLPAQAIKLYCITKSIPSPVPTKPIDIDPPPLPLPHYQEQQQHQCLTVPPTQLNALRQMQRHYGRFGRDAPCAGYITLACKSIDTLYLENRRI